MAVRAHNTSRRMLLAAPVLAAAPVAAGTHLPVPDVRLLQLLEATRVAEAEYSRAVRAQDDAAEDAAMERLEAALAEMADTAAEGWLGVAAKAARICRSLKESAPSGEWGTTIMFADGPVAASLMDDLQRLAPSAQA